MITSNIRRSFYLDLYTVVHTRTIPQQCRTVSTRSAINRGLRTTEPSKGSRVRSSNDGGRGSGGESQPYGRNPAQAGRRTRLTPRPDDAKVDRIRRGQSKHREHAIPSIKHSRGSLIRRHTALDSSEFDHAAQRRSPAALRNREDKRIVTTDDGEKVWADVRGLAKSISAIQDSERVGKVTTPPSQLIDTARIHVRDINTGLSAVADWEARQERTSYLVKQLSDVNGYLRADHRDSLSGIAEKTVVVERPGQIFEVMGKGQPLKWIQPSSASSTMAKGNDSSARQAKSPPPRFAKTDLRGEEFEVDLPSMRADLNRLRTALDDLHPHLSKSVETPRRASLYEQARQAILNTRILDLSRSSYAKFEQPITDMLNEIGTTKYHFRRRTADFAIRSPDLPDFEIRFPRSSGGVESRDAVGVDEDISPGAKRKIIGRAPSDRVTASRRGDRADGQGVEKGTYPVSIPYTTAASTFLYGANVVLAAMRAKRRKMYHLYLHPRAFARNMNGYEITRLAHAAGIPVEQDADIRLLDKMSGDRPHNGIVLETSALSSPPVLSLKAFNKESALFPIVLDRQSAEDIAVNGTPTEIATLSKTWRHPFIVFLDGITDPGNLGNILRTAHFYGVDAIAIATNTCAPLSSATLAKASSGACEAVRLLSLPRPANFVFDSAKAGWKVYAAVAPALPGKSSAKDVGRSVTTTALSALSPLAHHPCILMLGSEGEGLRANLTSKAHYLLSIENAARNGDAVDVGVDSLNVSVAGGVLMAAFLREPAGAAILSSKTEKSSGGSDVTEMDRANEKLVLQGGDLGF